MIILALGCIVGWSWHFSSKGYYDWIKSWIKVVHFYESKLKLNDGEEVFLYRLNGGENETPFSTQQLTNFFTLCIATGWTVMGILMLSLTTGLNLNISKNLFFVLKCFFVIVSAIVVGGCIMRACSLKNNLKKTHRILRGDLTNRYSIV